MFFEILITNSALQKYNILHNKSQIYIPPKYVDNVTSISAMITIPNGVPPTNIKMIETIVMIDWVYLY